ncbi:MAG: AraC family transcriptional regulator [Bacteroidota bacterium]
MLRQLSVPYTNPMEFMKGLYQKYGLNFTKRWGVYHASIPSGIGNGWITVFVKKDIHFICCDMEFHEKMEFHSPDPVENLIDIRVRASIDCRSSFLSNEAVYQWEMDKVNAVSAFIPQHYFDHICVDQIQKKIDSIDSLPPIRQSLDKLLSFQFTQNFSSLRLEGELIRYGYQLLEYLSDPTLQIQKNKKQHQISILKSVLDEQFNAPPDLHQASRLIGMNTTDLQRLFKKYYGVTINQYCIELRMKKAIYLVLNTELPITHIIQEVGYQNRSYFNQLYKARTGLSPREHRKLSSL